MSSFADDGVSGAILRMLESPLVHLVVVVFVLKNKIAENEKMVRGCTGIGFVGYGLLSGASSKLLNTIYIVLSIVKL